MDKQKAIAILNNAISGISTTRQNHEIMLQALNVLSAPEPKLTKESEDKSNVKELKKEG